MTREVVVAAPEMPVADAAALLRAREIRHLPVLDAGRLVGVVSDRDLRGAVPSGAARAAARTLADVMVRDVVTIVADAAVDEAARIMHERGIGCLPVLDRDRVVGILTRRDLLRAFLELMGATAGSSRLEVAMPNRPGELARVVRLIGIDFKINIQGLFMPPLDGPVSEATLRLQTERPAELVEALEKMGYRVRWVSTP